MMEKVIKISGINLNYFEGGNGKIIIFLHGWGQSSACFLELAEKIKNNHKVFLIDLPGFGKSGTPDFIWNYNDYTKIVQEFCEKLDIKNPIIVGHSFSSKIAYLLSRVMTTDKIIAYSGSLKENKSMFNILNICIIHLLQPICPTLLFYAHNKFFHPKTYNNFFIKNRRRAKIMLKIYAHLNFKFNKYTGYNKENIYFFLGKFDSISPNKLDGALFKKSNVFVFENSGHFGHISEPVKFEQLLGKICG